MPDFLAHRIADGKFTYAQVPGIYKEEVARILNDMGRHDLVE